MRSELNRKLSVYGQWTYRVAWALEIAAASIGLATGLTLGYQAYLASQGSEMSIGAIDLTLASAPFIMVALAELIKIPVATLMFSASWLWKPLLGVFLALLAFITFETVYAGLERASAQRQLRFDDIRTAISLTRDEIASREASLIRSETTTDFEVAQNEIDRISQLSARELDDKQREIDRIQALIENIRRRNPEYVTLVNQLEGVDEQLTAVLRRRDGEVSSRQEAFERQRDSFVERITRARESGDNRSVRRHEEELARLANPVPAIVNRYQPEIERLEDELRNLRERRRELATLASEDEARERANLEFRRDELENEKAEIARSWRARGDEARLRLADAQNRAQLRSETEERLRTELDELGRRLSEQERERVVAARTDQVRRFASSFYGGNPETVTDDQAGFIALIWFGSLAALAALAGPLTAIVALGLQRSAELRESNPRKPLHHYIRRWLVNWRFRRVRTVTVTNTVEVPIDREVVKKVEVPVVTEKVVKEILYLPILTDNPEAVRKALAKNLPPEVSDLVSVKTAEETHGSAA